MFNIQLKRKEVPPDAKWPDICRKEPTEGERTNIISILADVTDNMELIDMASYSMTGFGVDWDVDISYDLLSILKELPDLRAWLEDRWEEPFIITLCVRGHDGDVIFERCENTLILTLADKNDHSNIYGVENINVIQFAEMINEIVHTFSDCAKLLCPNLYEHVWFTDWHEAAEINQAALHESPATANAGTEI